jgi:hypothetical protein
LASGEASAAQSTSTQLEIEFVGGFAFVQDDPRLDVAYLKDTEIKLRDTRPLETGETNKTVCDVDQIGTELYIERGTIASVTPANAPGVGAKLFDLDKATVTFPALEMANLTLSANHTWPPVPPLPMPDSDPMQWQNLKFVPGLKKFHANQPLHSNWTSKINGRVRLKGGSITGDVPSNPYLQPAMFDFKEVSGATRVAGAAVTDRAIYKVTVPAANVVISITGGGPAPRSLTINPPAPGQPVKLRVRGIHADMLHSPTGKLHDFCAFYGLFNVIPPYETWLEPHVIMIAAPPSSTTSTTGGGQPSPGFYCPADWF